MSTRRGNPLIVALDHSSCEPPALYRVSVRSPTLNEALLQRLLDEHPSLLPLEIDRRLEGELVSLGREIPTPAGPIDNLFIDRSGHVVLVETKLARNPESRRKVVAQVLDYAAHVGAWDYDRLDRLWRVRPGNSGSLAERMCGSPDDDVQRWVGSVERNLRSGAMAVVIVADDIDPNAVRLAESVAGRATQLFTLSLVELRLFQMPGEHLLVLPNVVARTVEVERAVVRVVYEQRMPEATAEVRADPNVLSIDSLNTALQGLPNGTALRRISEQLLGRIEAEPSLTIEHRPKSALVLGRGVDIAQPVPMAYLTHQGTVWTYLPGIEKVGRSLGSSPDAIAAAVELVRMTFQELGAGVGKQPTFPLVRLEGRVELFVIRLVESLSALTRPT